MNTNLTALACIMTLFFSSASMAFDCTPATLKSELMQRKQADQAGRTALRKNPNNKQALQTVLETDRNNTAFMAQVVEHCGWPKRSEVGADAAQAAWLFTQHADMRPDIQAKAAHQMKFAVLAGEAEGKLLALLVDRYRRLSDQPQVYGHQFYSDDQGKVHFYDIINPSHLDSRRKEIGLPSFYCWAHSVSQRQNDAALAWPHGVLFQPENCEASAKSAP